MHDEMRVGQATETPSASASSSYLICRSTVIGSFGWVLVLAAAPLRSVQQPRGSVSAFRIQLCIV